MVFRSGPHERRASVLRKPGRQQWKRRDARSRHLFLRTCPLKHPKKWSQGTYREYHAPMHLHLPLGPLPLYRCVLDALLAHASPWTEGHSAAVLPCPQRRCLPGRCAPGAALPPLGYETRRTVKQSTRPAQTKDVCVTIKVSLHRSCWRTVCNVQQATHTY